MRNKRTAVLVGLLLTAALSGPAAPAVAAAGCNGGGCTGKNPATMQCTGATTSRDETTSGYEIELRSSPVASCGAVWARHQAMGDGDYYGFSVTISIERRRRGTTRASAFYTADIAPRQSGYTLMFARLHDYEHRACISEMVERACTPWFNSALQRVS